MCVRRVEKKRHTLFQNHVENVGLRHLFTITSLTLEILWKIPKKNFKFFTLGTFNGTLKIVPYVKKSLLQGAEKAKNRS